jgi:hypothetical protein
MFTRKQIDLAAGPMNSGERRAIALRLLAVAALACAMALAGCASRSAPRESEAQPTEAPREAAREAPREAPRIYRPDRALLKPQPAPDCEFKGANAKTMDPDLFARLKLDYERQCYRRAEKIARDRLRVLQASARCEVVPARYSPAVIR